MQDVSQILARAMQLHQGGHASAARTEYLRVLEHQPRNADAAHLLGLLLLGEDQADEALPYLDKAVEAAPGISGFLSTRAVALVNLGRLGDAIADYERALAISPDDAGLNYNLGLAFAQSGNFRAAKGAFAQAISLKPDFAEAHGNLGIALQELGEASDAVAAFEQALALQPDSPVLLNNLGLALQEAERTNDALQAFERALQLDPGNAQALCNKGNLLCEMNDWSAASSAFSAALAQFPDLAEAHFGLGYVAFRTGDDTGAAARLSKCLQCHPGDARALAYLSLVQGAETNRGRKPDLLWISQDIRFRQALIFRTGPWRISAPMCGTIRRSSGNRLESRHGPAARLHDSTRRNPGPWEAWPRFLGTGWTTISRISRCCPGTRISSGCPNPMPSRSGPPSSCARDGSLRTFTQTDGSAASCT